MKPDTSHIKQIKVVSNTHWDREFRRSFEKTRRRLLTMMDTTIDILEGDETYHSFTLDGHSILLDDYLEMRPERRRQVERLVREGRMIAGPYYTLAEEFSIGAEALVRNLLWGRKTVAKYGGHSGTVAYTPSSWGQTGQLPQILRDFGLDKMMFYRGVSHHESDAEFVWEAPDGSRVLASRFAVYARYNWYYQVHRAVTVGRTFAKDYVWGERDDVPMRSADSLAGEDLAFDLKSPEIRYDKGRLKKAIEDMVEAEGRHFTTQVFLAMHGHDISVAHPLESRIITDAAELLAGHLTIQHTNLESYWEELQKHLEDQVLPVLRGERRSYLKQGMWTFLFPSTISARTYLKAKDFAATNKLTLSAEPLSVLAACLGAEYPRLYLDRGWTYLLSNHTHDANGGCAPDVVCADMEYRYRKASDIADVVTDDAITHIIRNLSGEGRSRDTIQLVAFNPLPFERDAIVSVDLEVPRSMGAASLSLENETGTEVLRQPISVERSSSFVDSIWDVPTILESTRFRFYALFKSLPPLGYRTYQVVAKKAELRTSQSLVQGPDTLENEFLRVRVNRNGSCDIRCKETGRQYRDLNYLTDQGECGNAWRHRPPLHDRKYSTLGTNARLAIVEKGPLVASISAEYDFEVPRDCPDGVSRSEATAALPVRVVYCLEKERPYLQVTLQLDNTARDHWVRANFPSDLRTDFSWSDSHFDVVSRPIPLPDATGWVEQPGGTHPLQTFAALTDTRNTLAILPQGLFEYEASDDEQRTLALTLLRGCRIKLAVSEEKQTELPDPGIQCPGVQTFKYAIIAAGGDWRQADLLKWAAVLNAPVRAVESGRGKGSLPLESSLISIDGRVQNTCIKQSEDGDGIVIRLFNPGEQDEPVRITFGRCILAAEFCGMAEKGAGTMPSAGSCLAFRMAAKKIATLKVRLATG